MTEIQTALAQMSERERGTLAVWLLHSLPPHSGEDGSADSLKEAVRRRDELDSGVVKALSSEEFWASLAQERAAWK